MKSRKLRGMLEDHAVLCGVLLLLCFPSQYCFSPCALLSQQPWRHRSSLHSRATIKRRAGTGLQTDPHLVFPGGGIFFYWQAGVISFLRDQQYNLTATTATGASAGALTATLTAASVDFKVATSLALDMAAQAGIWDRKAGLQGIWGPIIHDWLDQLLPSNVLDVVDKRLSLLVTPVPSFDKERIESFESREDLINCNMASVHIPWFLDGNLVTSKFRNQPCIDGSFLAKNHHYHPIDPQDTIILDYKQDPAYQRRGVLDFVEAMSPDGIWSMLEDGKSFAKQMEEEGVFDAIPKLHQLNRKS